MCGAGGMHAVQRHGALISIMAHHLGPILGLLLRLLAFVGLDKLLLRPIHPTSEGLVQSVVKDVEVLKRTPLVPKDIGIYGFVYSTEDGSLKLVSQRHADPSASVKHLD